MDRRIPFPIHLYQQNYNADNHPTTWVNWGSLFAWQDLPFTALFSSERGISILARILCIYHAIYPKCCFAHWRSLLPPCLLEEHKILQCIFKLLAAFKSTKYCSLQSLMSGIKDSDNVGKWFGRQNVHQGCPLRTVPPPSLDNPYNLIWSASNVTCLSNQLLSRRLNSIQFFACLLGSKCDAKEVTSIVCPHYAGLDPLDLYLSLYLWHHNSFTLRSLRISLALHNSTATTCHLVSLFKCHISTHGFRITIFMSLTPLLNSKIILIVIILYS